jgi:signal transduction histidine kinase
MPDYYQLPALILTALLLPTFGHLYFRFRDTRSLLWFMGFSYALLRMILLYKLGTWDFADDTHPWMTAIGQTSIQISSALFLGSLSPLRFKVGRFNILYVVPFTLPLVVYSILFHGVLHGQNPTGILGLILPFLGLTSLVVAIFWGGAKGSVPTWLGVGACIAAGIPAFWFYFTLGAGFPLTYVECCNHLMTAMLLLFVFRRLSSGMVLSVLGFVLWSGPIVLFVPAISHNPAIDLAFTRAIILGKVFAALGMILLSLEDQLNINKGAEERERRARHELEAYTNLILSRRRVEDFDRQATEICQTVVENSRFAQSALILQTGGRYRVAGAAGLDPAIVSALDEMAARIPVEGFLTPDSAPSAVNRSHTLKLDLSPWLTPGDDLKRLNFTSVLAVPMTGRSASDGALLLSGMRSVSPRRRRSIYSNKLSSSLRADDLLPIEMLTARLQATRSQTMMLEKLIDSEKFAGLGQLASNVTQQLNNPLTVILGYASLLDETGVLDPRERKGIESILTEARRMRTTLESLTRISRQQNDQLDAVSVSELLTDMEELHRPEFLHRSIEFRLNVAPSLPKVLCRAQPLRQAVLHCLQFAIEAVETQGTPDSWAKPSTTLSPKTIRLEATSEGNLVQILVAHSGPGFRHPDRAFDPFVPTQHSGETSGLGLSLCATILRDHNGRASALNLEPQGAAIILELTAA